MKIELREHKVPKRTHWGTFEKSLGQYYAYIENSENGLMTQCGHVAPVIGPTAKFLPLAGFPQELCKEYATECSKLLDKPVAAGEAPPSLDKIAEIIADQTKVEPETESEDDE
jgi:hypothetical protein